MAGFGVYSANPSLSRMHGHTWLVVTVRFGLVAAAKEEISRDLDARFFAATMWSRMYALMKLCAEQPSFAEFPMATELCSGVAMSQVGWLL